MSDEEDNLQILIQVIRRWAQKHHADQIAAIESNSIEVFRRRSDEYRTMGLSDLMRVAVGIAKRVTKQEFRRIRRERTHLAPLSSDRAEGTEAQNIDDQLYAQQLISRLCPLCKEIVKLRFFHGMTLMEVARRFNNSYTESCKCHSIPLEWTTTAVHSRQESCLEGLRVLQFGR